MCSFVLRFRQVHCQCLETALLNVCAQAQDGLMGRVTQADMGLLNINCFCFMKTSYENDWATDQVLQLLLQSNLHHYSVNHCTWKGHAVDGSI